MKIWQIQLMLDFSGNYLFLLFFCEQNIAKEFYSFFVLNLLISDFFFIVIMQYKKLTREKTNIAQAPRIKSVEYIRINGRMFTSLHEHQHEDSTQDKKSYSQFQKSLNVYVCGFLVVFFFYVCIKFLQIVVFPKKIQRYVCVCLNRLFRVPSSRIRR